MLRGSERYDVASDISVSFSVFDRFICLVLVSNRLRSSSPALFPGTRTHFRRWVSAPTFPPCKTKTVLVDRWEKLHRFPSSSRLLSCLCWSSVGWREIKDTRKIPELQNKSYQQAVIVKAILKTSVHLSVHLAIIYWTTIYWLIYLSINWSIHLSIDLSIIHPTIDIDRSNFLSICPSIHPFI